MRKIDIIGKKFKTADGCSFVVLKELYRKSTEYYYLIRFLETGTEKIAEKRNLLHGHITDEYNRNIYGVACKGNASSKTPELNKIAFKRWYAMVSRCYNENAIAYKSYGAKGVTVSENWLCFENFLIDLPSIPGYDEEKYLRGEIQLDKDMILDGNKQYCKEMCQFVPRLENIRYAATRKRKFVAISPTGERYTFYFQTDCAKKFGLTARTIGKVLDGHLKSHKGWTFKYEV